MINRRNIQVKPLRSNEERASRTSSRSGGNLMVQKEKMQWSLVLRLIEK